MVEMIDHWQRIIVSEAASLDSSEGILIYALD
jgi:hypothetical protein